MSMGLLTAAFVKELSNKGLIKENVVWDEKMNLCDWLNIIQVPVNHPIVQQFFGVPYLPLEKNIHLRHVERNEIPSNWPLYYCPSKDCYLCTRPPRQEERAIFQAQYGEAALYLTDAEAVHSSILNDLLPVEQRSQTERVRFFSLDQLLRQETGHVDGVIGRILADAIAAEATDIHLCKTRAQFEIRFRIAGTLMTYANLYSDVADILINKLKLMAEMDIAEHRLPQDGHIELHAESGVYHLRLGTLPLLNGEKIVIRLLPEQQRLTQFADLGFNDAQINMLKQMLAKRQGLLLITGPTNSGKTTTLYACLQALAQTGALVYTIEDPVEVVLPQVQQMQVNNRGGFSFAAGLRGILRCDPDVIAVGELRDSETVDIAAKAALSGHLVIATLHAYNAHQVINRLRDLGLSNRLMSAVLLAVVNQRLLPRRCPMCHGAGVTAGGQCCSTCEGHGSSGRVGVQEIWQPTMDECDAIEAGESSYALREKALAQGFMTIEARLKQQTECICEPKVGIR